MCGIFSDKSAVKTVLNYYSRFHRVESVTDRIDNVHYSIKNMEKPKPNAKPTRTGERYITRKGNLFRLNIQRKNLRIDRNYKTLDEAVMARQVIIGDEKHYAR